LIVVGGEEDEAALWWAAVIGVAAYWLLGEDEGAETLATRVEALPESLSRAGDPLPRAILAAYRARRALLLGTTKGNVSRTVLRHCATAGRLLDHSLSFSACKQSSTMVLVRAINFYFLCCAWIFILKY
jgi:sterol regulatory element-binding transcription factor 1